MTCTCDAAYSDAADCPRCSGAPTERWFARRPSMTLPSLPALTAEQLALPPLPDGPDEMLTEMAELEAVVAHERHALDREDGARRCRFCRGSIPAGDAPGVHEACLPETLPEGARSCAGCAELILDDDDDFEHDFCMTPGDSFDEDEDPDDDLAHRLGLAITEGMLYGDGDDEPTERMVALPEPMEGAPRVVEDSVMCLCGRWNPVKLVARLEDLAPPRIECLSGTSVTCECSRVIGLTYSWRRGCFVTVSYGDADPIVLTN